MAARHPNDVGALALIALAATVGHAVVVPAAVTGLRGLLGGERPLPLATAEEAMTVLPPPPTPEAAPMVGGLGRGAFHASTRGWSDEGAPWLIELRGDLVVGPRGAIVHVERGKVHTQLDGPATQLVAARLDLAEPAADGAWTLLREGIPVAVELALGPGGHTHVLPRLELHAPGAGLAEARGRTFVVTFFRRTGDRVLLTHVPADPALVREVLERAASPRPPAPR